MHSSHSILLSCTPECGVVKYNTYFICYHFRGLNPTEGEVQDIINQYDMDGNGNVRYLDLQNTTKIEHHKYK